MYVPHLAVKTIVELSEEVQGVFGSEELSVGAAKIWVDLALAERCHHLYGDRFVGEPMDHKYCDI